jgi:hypothetical protein
LIGSLVCFGLFIGINVLVLIVQCPQEQTRREAIGAFIGFAPLELLPGLLMGWIEWIVIHCMIAGFNQATGAAAETGWLGGAIAGGAIGLSLGTVILILELRSATRSTPNRQ